MPFRPSTLIAAWLLVRMAAAQAPIIYRLDLTDQRDDQLHVEVLLPELEMSTVTFAFPRVVPGIYGPMDHGRLVHGLLAFTADGGPLLTRRLDVNTWVIEDGRALHRITYAVDDGWEEFDLLFQQGSYRSSEGTYEPSAAVINANCVFGYVRGAEDLPCTLEMKKDPKHYIATSLPRAAEANGPERFIATDYRALVDAPMLVAAPDTFRLKVRNADVLVACHSTTGRRIAQDIAAQVEPMIADQIDYLGGTLPVERYTILVYHNPSPTPYSTMADGLEHARSTLVLLCLPLDANTLAGTVRAILSHEVFHTLLPIKLHSEEIEHYDFAAPRMSRHLWLYEGMTEYFAIHMPVVRGTQTVEEFLAEVGNKIHQMEGLTDDIPLTELSIAAMERQDQYINFYRKGTLFCMLLDIELLAHSKGAYGVRQLVKDMAAAYGMNKPFKDEELFAEMARVSGMPAIADFLVRYLAEPGKLPLQEQLARVGIAYDDSTGIVGLVPKPDKEQARLRKAWLGH